MKKVVKHLAIAMAVLVMAACGNGGDTTGGGNHPTVVRAKSLTAQGTMVFDDQKGVTSLRLGVDSGGVISGLKSAGHKWSDVDSAAFTSDTGTIKAAVNATEKEITLSANYRPISASNKIMITMKDGNGVAVNLDTIDFYTDIAVTYEESGDTFTVSPHI